MAIIWPLVLCFFGVALTAFAKNDDKDVRLRALLKKETLSGRQSTSHTFTNLELLNIVSRRTESFSMWRSVDLWSS